MGAHGYVDGVRDGRLLGWAYDADRPGERLELEAMLDGQLIGRCVADVAREDLVRAGIGDGRHGFRLPLPQMLVRGMSHELQVRALGDRGLIGLAADYFADAPGDPGLPDPELVAAATAPALDRTQSAAIRGPDGWCFTPPPDRLERALGRQPARPAEVETALGILAARHRDLAARGIEYLVVAVPDKAAVYPDRLPAPYKLDAEHRPAARLNARMRAEPRLELLDLWPVLRDARGRGRVFHRRSDRLTWTGAFHGYRAVAKELAKRRRGGEPLPADWLVLGGLVDVGAEDEREAGLDAGRLSARASVPAAGLARVLSDRATVLERPGELEAAVIVHDGGATRIAPFLGEHFSPLVIEPSGQMPAALIELVKPAVVVEFLADGGSLL